MLSAWVTKQSQNASRSCYASRFRLQSRDQSTSLLRSGLQRSIFWKQTRKSGWNERRGGRGKKALIDLGVFSDLPRRRFFTTSEYYCDRSTSISWARPQPNFLLRGYCRERALNDIKICVLIVEDRVEIMNNILLTMQSAKWVFLYQKVLLNLDLKAKMYLKLSPYHT